ncbi:DUF2156 domain-containing protein [Thermoproteota archaeon]
MIPDYPALKTLTCEDFPILKQYLDAYAPQICELSPIVLEIWREIDHPKLTMLNGNLCISISPENMTPFFLEPIGQTKLIETVTQLLQDHGRLSRVSQRVADQLSGKHEFSITPLRDHFDYMYKTQVLSDLKGRQYDGKRNHINKFKRAFSHYEFIPITRDFKDAALAVLDEWHANKKERHEHYYISYLFQRIALEHVFKCFDKYSVMGEYIQTDQGIKGFMLGSPLNADTCCAHFQYGLYDAPGIFPVLLQQFCKQVKDKYTFINLEQDMGIPGIRKAKLSYYPIELIMKYEVLFSHSNV